jgi:hypothetical protein
VSKVKHIVANQQHSTPFLPHTPRRRHTDCKPRVHQRLRKFIMDKRSFDVNGAPIARSL